MNTPLLVHQLQALNIGIDFFCVFELLIILRYIHRHTLATEEYILFRYIIVFTILALIGDGTCWVVNGMDGAWIHVLNYLANFLYMSCQLIAAMLTFVFFYWIIYSRLPSRKFRILVFVIPVTAVLLLTYTTPWTGLVFTINQENFYQREILLPLMSMITLAYIIAGSFLCALRIKQEVLLDRKRRLRVLACYCIPVILGSLIQTSYYGISLVLPCSAAALLMVFINEQDLKISVDSLTGLNNRGCFDRYLNEQLEMNSRDDIGLIMIDVNDFKKINDEYGHIKGDAVLQMIAEILRRSAGNKNIFLARYGGDEFACIFHTAQTSADEITEAVIKEVDHCNRSSQMPEISLAAGYAQYDKDSIHTAAELIHHADDMMYENKQMMKQKVNSSENDQEKNSFLKLNKKK